MDRHEERSTGKENWGHRRKRFPCSHYLHCILHIPLTIPNCRSSHSWYYLIFGWHYRTRLFWFPFSSSESPLGVAAARIAQQEPRLAHNPLVPRSNPDCDTVSKSDNPDLKKCSNLIGWYSATIHTIQKGKKGEGNPVNREETQKIGNPKQHPHTDYPEYDTRKWYKFMYQKNVIHSNYYCSDTTDFIG